MLFANLVLLCSGRVVREDLGASVSTNGELELDAGQHVVMGEESASLAETRSSEVVEGLIRTFVSAETFTSLRLNLYEDRKYVRIFSEEEIRNPLLKEVWFPASNDIYRQAGDEDAATAYTILTGRYLQSSTRGEDPIISTTRPFQSRLNDLYEGLPRLPITPLVEFLNALYEGCPLLCMKECCVDLAWEYVPSLPTLESTGDSFSDLDMEGFEPELYNLQPVVSLKRKDDDFSFDSSAFCNTMCGCSQPCGGDTSLENHGPDFIQFDKTKDAKSPYRMTIGKTGEEEALRLGLTGEDPIEHTIDLSGGKEALSLLGRLFVEQGWVNSNEPGAVRDTGGDWVILHSFLQVE